MNAKISIPFIVVAALLLPACTAAPPVKDTPPAGELKDPPAVTTTALIPITAATLPAATTQAPTPTHTPTLTPLPSATPTLTFTARPVRVPCNQMDFAGDITVPDGTAIEPGHAFTKTWRLQNVGACEWTTSYDLVFISGDAMGGPAAVGLPYPVNPGDTVDISVRFIAPQRPGVYQSNWILLAPDGTHFGLGVRNDLPIWVKILVSTPAQAPKP